MYNKNHFRSLLMLISLVMTGAISYGQRPLDIDEIQVIAPYVPTISDAYKININPVIEDTISIDTDFDYRIRPQRIVTRFAPEALSPARMRGEPLTKLYRGLVKGGYGSYQTPYFEAYYNTLRSNQYALGLHARHLSSNKDIKDLDNSVFSQNYINAFGTRFYRNTSLNANISFNRHALHYYGIPLNNDQQEDHGDNPLIRNENIHKTSDDMMLNGIIGSKQRFNLLSTEIGYGTHHGDTTKTNYRFGLEHHWLSDIHDASEHHLRGAAYLKKDIGEDPFGLAWKQFFRMDVTADFFHNKKLIGNDHDSISNTGILSFKTGIYSNYDKLRFHIGVNVSVKDDHAKYELKAWPVAGFEAAVVPGKYIFYMDLTGGLHKNSYRSLSAVNPFMQSGASLDFSNTRSQITGGFRGSMNDLLSFHIFLRNSRIDNQPFFVNSYLPGPEPSFIDNRFNVVYDDVSILNIHGAITTRYRENLLLRLQADYFDYNLSNMPKAWHMPNFTTSLHAKYNIQNKIILTADLIGRGKTYGLDLSAGESESMESRKLHDFYLDANLGIEYRYTKLLSVFLKFYNMQNESYERWTYYPTQGFSFLGGVSYAF